MFGFSEVNGLSTRLLRPIVPLLWRIGRTFYLYQPSFSPFYSSIMDIIEQAKQYADRCHRETNHTYAGKPYSFHLQMVFDTAQQFIHLIPEAEREHVFAACWVHDCIEDCRQTYNDVKEATNETVAELAYALTNEKGKNRAERANDRYYTGIRNTPFATFVKLCDRIANVAYSVESNPKKLDLYRSENAHFTEQLWDVRYEELFLYLEGLLGVSRTDG